MIPSIGMDDTILVIVNTILVIVNTILVIKNTTIGIFVPAAV